MRMMPVQAAVRAARAGAAHRRVPHRGPSALAVHVSGGAQRQPARVPSRRQRRAAAALRRPPQEQPSLLGAASSPCAPLLTMLTGVRRSRSGLQTCHAPRSHDCLASTAHALGDCDSREARHRGGKALCVGLQGSQGEEPRYLDFRERRQQSPPRYERAVLERLHEVRAAQNPKTPCPHGAGHASWCQLGSPERGVHASWRCRVDGAVQQRVPVGPWRG
jgi:hypothetical protein